MKMVEISGLIENGMWNYGDELNIVFLLIDLRCQF
jgi:hypothetical protein